MSNLITGWLPILLQLVIAGGLLNVWIVRFGIPTKYRGGASQNMIQEFAVYGLPPWVVYVVGFLKITIALLLLVSFFVPGLLYSVGLYALIVLVVLMMGALSMHIRVRDPLIKSLPALLMFVANIVLIYLIR